MGRGIEQKGRKKKKKKYVYIASKWDRSFVENFFGKFEKGA